MISNGGLINNIKKQGYSSSKIKFDYFPDLNDYTAA